jgi:signal-transduction protein with cAMP-binding, CBS, and nucleotidyltransferase domain
MGPLPDGPPGPKERIKAVPIFDKLNSMQLHRLASTAASKTFLDGEAIVQQGGAGDAMYIIEHGRGAASVEGVGVVQNYLPGDFFGELALLTGEARSASVHATGECICLVLHAAAVAPILDASWGQGELRRREELLQRVPIFEMLSQGELRRLATQLERVSFADNGVQIIGEGEIGEAMYVLRESCSPACLVAAAARSLFWCSLNDCHR